MNPDSEQTVISYKDKTEFLSRNWLYLENHSFFVNSIFDLIRLNLSNNDLEYRNDLSKDDHLVFRRVSLVDIDLQDDAARPPASHRLLHSLRLHLHRQAAVASSLGLLRLVF